MPIRVVVAEDAFLVREAVTRLLAEAPGVEPVAAVSDSATLMATIEAERPDVVVTDIRMPPTRRATRASGSPPPLRETHPRDRRRRAQPVRRARRTSSRCSSSGSDAARLPAQGARPRPRPARRRRSAPCTQGGSVIDPKVVELLVAARPAPARLAARRAHAARARDRSAEIAQGKSNAAIAESLVLTKRAVEKHINAIFMKLDLAGRARRQPPREGRAAVPRGERRPAAAAAGP